MAYQGFRPHGLGLCKAVHMVVRVRTQAWTELLSELECPEGSCVKSGVPFVPTDLEEATSNQDLDQRFIALVARVRQATAK